MKRVILYMAASIDGCIARSDGSVDWMDTSSDLGDESCSTQHFLTGVDTILMGRKSYDQAVSFGEWPWANHRTLVFSRSGLDSKTPNTEVITDLNPAFINSLKCEDGKNIWLFGGGNLNHFFLENDLIDEIRLYIQPVVLGKGIGIFGNKPVNLKKFVRKESKELGGGFTLLRYRLKVTP